MTEKKESAAVDNGPVVSIAVVANGTTDKAKIFSIYQWYEPSNLFSGGDVGIIGSAPNTTWFLG